MTVGLTRRYASRPTHATTSGARKGTFSAPSWRPYPGELHKPAPPRLRNPRNWKGKPVFIINTWAPCTESDGITTKPALSAMRLQVAEVGGAAAPGPGRHRARHPKTAAACAPFGGRAACHAPPGSLLSRLPRRWCMRLEGEMAFDGIRNSVHHAFAANIARKVVDVKDPVVSCGLLTHQIVSK